MFGKNEYIGLNLGEQSIRIARISVENNKVTLQKLDRVTLVEPIKSAGSPEDAFDEGDNAFEQDSEAVFGFEEEDTGETDEFALEEDEDEEDISFEDLEEEAESSQEDIMSLDMVDEAETAQSNEILLFNLLTDIDSNKIRLGLNVPAGNTIFQIIRDTDFNEVKKKDLIADLEEKLESIYGVAKSDDYYSYEVREDGTLQLASVEEESPMLRLLNSAEELYSGKLIVEEIYPDEAALIGLARSNYELDPDEITGIIQFSETTCRTIFLKGNELWQVSPLINEGTRDSSFLNTVFSKILFQLDTGEVPNLDRIILVNNTLGEEAVEFFQQNFSDIPVHDFQFDEEKFDARNYGPDQLRGFTTAIATAWAASGYEKQSFPDLSLIPSYVIDRQKIFKIQWHGVLLLLLIFLTPLTFNYFYQKNVRQIDSLGSELDQINAQLAQVTSTAESTNEISQNLALLREKLVLLDTLSQGSREWSTKLDLLNDGLRSVGNTWLTSMSPQQDKTFLQGYTLYRNRIPRVVNLFHEATLLNVNIDNVREQEIFRFSIMVERFVENEEAYSLPKPEDLKQILNN